MDADAPNRLAELRKAHKVSRAALSRDLGVADTTVWRWEHGQVAIPDAHKRTLTARFGVTVEYLLAWDEAAA